MIEVSKLLLLVLGELLLVGVVISLVIVFQAFSRRQRDRTAVRKLVSRIKEDSGRRESETRKIMQERFGYDGKNLEEIVSKIAREEKAFYQVLIDVYLHHKTDAIQNLCVDYESSVETYRNLELPQATASQELSEEAIEESEAYRLLLGENERLTEELKKTMDTMAEMLSEYSHMFSGGAGVEMDRGKLGEIVAEQQAVAQGGPVSDEASATGGGPDGEGEETEAAVESADEDTELQQALDAGGEEAGPDVDQSAAADGESGKVADLEELEDLKELDDELAMLDLADEDPAAGEKLDPDTELDETVAIRPEESDEVVDLEDVLGDTAPSGDEKK